MSRRLLWCSGALGIGAVALFLVGSVLLPRLLLARAVAEATRRGFTLHGSAPAVGWLTLEMRDADLELEGVPGLDAHFGTLRVTLDGSLRPKFVAATAGRLVARDGDGLRAALQGWRSRRPRSANSLGERGVALNIEFDSVSIDGLKGGQLGATRLRLRREADQTEVRVGSLDASIGKLSLKANDGRAMFEGGATAVHDAAFASAAVVWTLDLKPELPEVALAPPKDPPEAEPRVLRKQRGLALAKKEGVAAPLPPLLPDPHALRAALAVIASSAVGQLPVGANLRVDALSVRVQRGEEELSLGSGKCELGRDERRIELTFSTSPVAHATPLALVADLPTGAGDVEVSASGGPVSLGLLGMHDGGLLHLLDVDRTSFAGRGKIVLDDKGQSVTFDVEGALRGLSVSEPRLAHDPVRGMDLGVRARGVVDDKGELRLDEAEASLGAARVTLHGAMSQTPDHTAAAFDFDFPTSSCQALLTSVPSALLPTVGAARMDGTFSLRGHLAFDTASPDTTAFDYDVTDRCRLVDVPSALDRSRFTHDFTHVVYSKVGEPEEETTGPGTPNWTDLDDISPFMQVAVLTTEDGAFFHHHGFSHAAIRHALIADIKARRFIRGASTITMQLAKNLFLSREKTLARKLEELVLADYLEQVFTKDEMMELYLNIIEFGPDLYGVTNAAQHYFGRHPNELNLAECLFLSSILPNPVAFHKVYEKGGQVGDGWMRTIHARMEVAARNGLISPAQLAEGLTETVVFHHDGDPTPTPRAVVNAPAHTDNGGDWEPLN
jgi:hypothetical protein